MSSASPSDSELTRRAQSGEPGALGLLLARHRAGMRAVALSLLGHVPDVDDALQDAALVALRRIGGVRDPAAVGPWLRMIVRNTCRMRLRAPAMVPFTGDFASKAPTPEQIVDEHALRDWVWHAIEELSPPLRTAVMLRHFSEITSYEQIAAACEVPVGTVRSRLSQARAKLAEALLATATLAHDDAAALTAASAREAVETLAAAERGAMAEVAAERWSPRFELVGGQGERGGPQRAVAGMNGDLEAGVHQRFVQAVASRDIVIWEMDLINPPDDPEHCPPSVAWLMDLREGRVRRLRLFHPMSGV
ncbi:sigma-70 family RNA polymerase sigma factor [Actinoallomurus bryophytorum]|uniref:RNA polymerase sigma-70 factor (ECF subfamily) n=1 Tax=Actinoallomurus bryophytorum TaxID=1490222 RepID=A0A543CDC9_9ACTN|nr:sigma-70 family RNA polymerase sigma factor [Actinoallomurus bryophytorum]TQL95079.1 RNA polymerase sigma-70 factor (ECF subfamily) [Actinoallomurus bryophytorum]